MSQKIVVQGTKEVLNSTASLAAAGSTSASFYSEGYARLRGMVVSNASLIAGSGITIRQALSQAAATSGSWDYVTTSNLTACSGSGFDVTIYGSVVQVFHKTDGAASIFRSRWYLLPL